MVDFNLKWLTLTLRKDKNYEEATDQLDKQRDSFNDRNEDYGLWWDNSNTYTNETLGALGVDRPDLGVSVVGYNDTFDDWF